MGPFLGSVTRSDLRFPLATGSPVWAESLLFLLAYSLPSLGVSLVFPGCPLGFLLSVSAIISPPSSFAWVGSAFSILVGFSFRSPFLGSLLPFSNLSFTILPSSSVVGRGSLAAVLARVAGLCLPSFGLQPCVLLSSGVCGGWRSPWWFLFVCVPLVSRPSGTSGGCSGVPSSVESSPQTASLFPFLQSFPVLCLFAFLSRAFCSQLRLLFAGSRLLACCHCSSSRLPYYYYAFWHVYRAWCRRYNHSLSLPSMRGHFFSFVLSCSLALSCSSLASFGSVLSGVFCLVLPGLSSHFVLRSFCFADPVSSSCVPPWVLSMALASQGSSL